MSTAMYIRTVGQQAFLGVSDVVKHKSLYQYLKHLCQLELLEYKKVFNGTNSRYSLYIMDTPDTANQIVSYIRKHGLESGIVKKIDIELTALYLEIDKHLEKFHNKKKKDELMKPGVKRVNLKYLLPFLDWLAEGVTTDYGFIWVSFYHLKYINAYASRRMKEIAEVHSSCRNLILPPHKKGKRISYFYYAYNWLTSPYFQGDHGDADEIGKYLGNFWKYRKRC